MQAEVEEAAEIQTRLKLDLEAVKLKESVNLRQQVEAAAELDAGSGQPVSLSLAEPQRNLVQALEQGNSLRGIVNCSGGAHLLSNVQSFGQAKY